MRWCFVEPTRRQTHVEKSADHYRNTINHVLCVISGRSICVDAVSLFTSHVLVSLALLLLFTIQVPVYVHWCEWVE